MGRRWWAVGVTLAVACSSVAPSVDVQAESSARPHVAWSGQAAKARAAERDRMMADTKARFGATLPDVVWMPTVQDGLGDQISSTKYAQGDLRGMWVASNTEPGAPSLFLSVSVQSWVRPTNTSWVDFPTFIAWIIDTNGDSKGEFIAEFVDFGGLLYGDVYDLNRLDLNGRPLHVCNAIPLFDKDTSSYGVYVGWGCLKNPTTARVYARMEYVSRPDPLGPLRTSVDEVPNTGWVSVASRVKANPPGRPVTSSAPASLDVSWAAPTASLWPVTDYVVQYSAASPVAWKTFADGVSVARTARVTGLTPGKSYLVRVASKNALGTSAYSSASAAKTALAAGVVPSAPGRPTGTPGTGRVTVTWTLPAKAGSHPITDYQLDYSTNAGATWLRVNDGVSTARSAVVTGLTPASRILVRVRAKSFAGVSAWSANSAVLAPRTTPSAPRSLTVGADNGSLSPAWLAPTSNGGGEIDGYRVLYRPAPEVAPAAPAAAPAVTGTEIVNGSTTTIATAPWQVRLRIDLGGGNFGLCGGSLIDPQWVVTAAHCVYGKTASQMLVHAGITLQTDMNALNGVKVDKVIQHGSYNPGVSESNDIALLHLVKAAGGTPIQLLGDPTEPVATTPALITGWGTTQYQGSESDPLRKATVSVQADPGDPCGLYGAEFVPATMLCARGTNLGAVTDTCQGDSGGPLVVGAPGAPRLAGITSFGNECALPSYPGVYTRVSTYVRWIQDRVESTWPYVDVPCTADCSSTTIAGLPNGTTYEIKVRAHNAYGYGSYSPVVTRLVGGLPGNPTGVTATGDSTSVQLTWVAPLDDGGLPILDYEYSEDGGATWHTAGVSDLTVTFVPTDPAGTTVTYQVRAVNAQGAGPAESADPLTLLPA